MWYKKRLQSVIIKIFKMAALLIFVCAILACKTQAQFLPRLPQPQLCNPPPQICNPPPQICNPPPQICNPPPQICNPPPQICNPPPQICNPPPQICNPPPVICNTPPQPCTTSPQVVTTIVDNSVSNSLANAIQLLIVSNLIENTMKSQCGCDPIQTVYPPIIDCLTPKIDYINPYNPYDPIITPCDIITPCPCDPIEIIPNVCYPDVLPIPNIGCGCDGPNYGLATVLPNYGCGCDGFGPNFGANIGCGCDGPRYGVPNIGCGCGCDNCGPKYGLPNGCGCDTYTIQNFGLPNIGCGCDNCGPKYGLPNGCSCDTYTSQNFGLPNIGCGCDSCGPKFGLQNIGYELLANALGSRCGCDIPIFAPQNCNCGFPNLPVGFNVESLGFLDSCGCPNKCGVYY